MLIYICIYIYVNIYMYMYMYIYVYLWRLVESGFDSYSTLSFVASLLWHDAL